ncbi:MAG: FAD-dependent oxidoreductase [Hyphomonadaceae bacterium]|nr:FAD-dependent oxidoreductase [Hyphomonadaceae bacterium]
MTILSLQHVFKPISIGSVETQNRIVRTAHVTNLWKAGGEPDDLIAYHAARASGGCGLSILEVLSVHPSSDGNGLPNGPRLEEGLSKLMSAVRPHGMRVFVQLWHGGFNASQRHEPLWSASNAVGPLQRAVPRAMTLADIDALIEGYVKTAQRCLAAGVDGIEVHLAHGYLLQQFLSPLTNSRTDAYGGTAKKRARLPLEILTELRCVSSGAPLGVRVSPECVDGGMGVEGIVDLIGELEKSSLADFVDISQGGYFARSRIAGAAHFEPGYQLETSAEIAACTQLPTIVSGRFETLQQADEVIARGVADLVGLTRAQIADPDLVAKARAGRASEVRPCLACNQGCLGGVRGPFARLGCTVNPDVGFEKGEPSAASTTGGRVVVVGGGPAGMAAARAAAMRGARVALFEARRELGGQAALAARAPHYAPLARFLFWQQAELERTGVEVIAGVRADARRIAGYKPDRIIIATGSSPRLDGRPAERPGSAPEIERGAKVRSSWDVLSSEDEDLGSSAIVFDDLGHAEAIAVSEHLLSRGVSVTFVTTFSSFAPFLAAEQRLEPALERLTASRRFQLVLRSRISKVGRGESIVEFLGGAARSSFASDIVVMVQPNAPERTLFDELKESALNAICVGDALGPRFLGAAIRDGEMSGRA